MSREKSRPTTRVSRNQTKVVRAAPIRRYRPPYENCTTRLPAPLNPSRRVAREADATLPRSRLRCARWTSIIYHRGRPRSAKHRLPRNGRIGSARGKSEMSGQLARQASIRTVKHWRAAKRALQYLWRTKDLGITYGGTPGSSTKPSAWMDADSAACPDTRRSVSGGAVMLGGGAISWFSRVQEVTAAASSESEYVALAKVVNELRFLRQVKGFLTPPINDSIIPRENNEGAIKMATNRFSSRRTRHVDVKHHIVRDAVESGTV